MDWRSLGYAGLGVGIALALAVQPARALDRDLYARLLERHTAEVRDLARVRVDYAGLRLSPGWGRLVRDLAASDPEALRSRAERMAFWINAYNILAIDLVVRHYPLESIRDIGSLLRPVWDRPAGRVGSREVTLGEIEHRILRPLGDPRIHAALVCASLSCPPLRREPYDPQRLNQQLDNALTAWLADSRKGARLDRTSGTLYLSRVFRWFEEDFAANGGVLAFLRPFWPPEIRAWLDAQPAAPALRYLEYDWSLNDLASRAEERAEGAAASRVP